VDTNLPWQKKRMIPVKAGLYPNYLIFSKQKTWYHELLLNAEFPYCGMWEGSVGFWGFGDSDMPQPTVGFKHFRLMSLGPLWHKSKKPK